MPSYTTNTQTIIEFQNHPLQATFYKPAQTEMKTILLYFHGGGFIFGSRRDLPKEYLELFARTGIGILAIDYPLAPETKLPVLREMTNKVTKWFVEQFLPANSIEAYFILGRSAGAYLALVNGHYAEKLSTQLRGIISLYGYYTLNDASFTVPNRYYLQYPKIKDNLIASQIQKEPLLESTNQNRTLIYIAARQKGNWMDLVLDTPTDKADLSMDKEQLNTLPPLFLAAATNDPDVPSRQSRQMANLHETATLHLIESDEHDFDRTHIDTLGIELYEKMIDWILALLA